MDAKNAKSRDGDSSSDGSRSDVLVIKEGALPRLPQIRRGPLSFVTLSWLDPLLKRGFRKPLEEGDLPDISDNDKAKTAAEVLKAFEARLAAHLASPATVPAPSLAGVLFRAVALFFIGGVLLQACLVAATIVRPLMIPQVLRALAHKTQPQVDVSGLWTTSIYGLAGIFFGLQLVVALSNYTFESMLVNLNIKVNAAVVGAIYAKALRLSPKARQTFSEGKIATLASSDSAIITGFSQDLILTVGNLVQIALALYYLSLYFGKATWAAVGIYLFFALAQLGVLPFLGAAVGGYMGALDKRTKTLREFLYGIKVIKYQALEEHFATKIGQIRSAQLKALKQVSVVFVMLIFTLVVQQFLVAPVSIIVYASINGKITAEDIFTGLGLINTLIGPSSAIMNTLKYGIGWDFSVLQISVSYRRVVEFLLAEEVKPGEVSLLLDQDASTDGTALKMSAATFTWEEARKDDNEKPKSKRRITKKQKKAAAKAEAEAKVAADAAAATATEAGTDASAESAANKGGDAESDKPAPFALQDISLEIPRGSLVAVVGSVGSGKSSFLSALIGGMRKTAGDSALFGSVAYCAQEPWILTGTIEDNIVFGDDAVRARIPDAIAAACLDRDLEILPNGLGTQIGEKGINLSGGQKARVALARAIARDADIYLLDDPIAALDAHVGKKVFDDAICGVLRGKTVFLVTHQLHLLPKVDMVVVLDEGRVIETGAFRELMAREDGALAEIMKDYHFDDAETETAKEAIEADETEGDKPENLAKAVKAFEEEKAVAEDRRVGAFTFSTVRSYFLAGGFWFLGSYVLTIAYCVALDSWIQIFLSLWTSERWAISQSDYLKIYIGINCVLLVGYLFNIISSFAGGYASGKALHERALVGLVRAPMEFFDSQPIGRVLNRMTTDVRALDTGMGMNLTNFTANFVQFLTSIVVVSYAAPYVLILFGAILILAVLLFRYYQKSYRELKRLQSIMQSPLVAHISESLNGIPSILAYGVKDRFISEQQRKMDMTNASAMFISSAQSWLGFRLTIMSSMVILLLLILTGLGLIDSTAVGLSLVYAINLGDSLMSTLLLIGTTEASFNAVERLNHYANDLPAEAARELPTDPKDGAWPTAGAVAIRDLEIRYPSRPDHAVIQDLSLDIRPGEKVGVVGRTGSGKSTLMTALFRIMEASKGSIAIDGIDIASLGLKTLRSRLQIIPQDPVLFKGTVRSNLDFAGKYTDDELWAALDVVGLKDFVGSLDGKLDAAIDENGANLSMGQRQLMCLCKAILAKPKVLIMDEATASVDAEADKRIQESIETQFAATTVLSIAHRLNTIAVFDRVLVLDGGRIAEFDAPHVLLGRAGSVFGEMVEATGAANAAVIRQIAADHFAKSL
ncbi:hypothetical protein HK105_203066 [Polyrhizophydium stewartii]|uniref:P-loop containing nucleoside triphosphate hydrolase protein n=1 Tax=Polyrhizophydium stewartii TaxID=2732419 RepID=A0ABR4NCZ8_9FUNG|nr:Canalicular multispecific organic anion transporter 2 [Polyrhizophydium stewartii]